MSTSETAKKEMIEDILKLDMDEVKVKMNEARENGNHGKMRDLLYYYGSKFEDKEYNQYLLDALRIRNGQ